MDCLLVVINGYGCKPLFAKDFSELTHVSYSNASDEYFKYDINVYELAIIELHFKFFHAFIFDFLCMGSVTLQINQCFFKISCNGGSQAVKLIRIFSKSPKLRVHSLPIGDIIFVYFSIVLILGAIFFECLKVGFDIMAELPKK
ncbi:hypothetical protein RF11_16274 [Thelohanellus kitauei]|uniref:Uncharacterized protein n=1 Tax=Thelohanellus kitauei TaxID=669202 RepID=A0A0C2IV06_THEKT|nr:hypothetical protein RF11_16274 [Thelohanellus kitauei]